MIRIFYGFTALLLVACLGGCGSKQPLKLYKPWEGVEVWETGTGKPLVKEEQRPRVRMRTNVGDIVPELFPSASEVTVENFMQYVEKDFYEGTIFHRVVPNFVIQGGGFTHEMGRKPTELPIINESKNQISNARGTIAMARTQDPNSATSQFFINLSENTFLDHDGNRDGYAVFGRVVEGMEVVDRIGAVKTGNQAGMQDVPLEPVVILGVESL